MTEWYPELRDLHIAAVLLSGSLFAVRGTAVQSGVAWAMAAPVRFLSYGIDTLLLLAALLLVASLPAEVFANGWLVVKLVLLVAYIVCGSLALKRAPDRRQKLGFYLLALVLFAAIYVTARAHDPGAVLALLSG